MSVKKVAVIGLGYVGLPLAMAAIRAGYEVVGIDTDEKRIDLLDRAESYVEDITSKTISKAIDGNKFSFSTDYSKVVDFDVAIITVPTPLLNGIPDLSFVESSAKSLSKYIKPGCLIVLESTTYPGTTEELLIPALESNTLFRATIDFYVGYSPERIDPGNKVWTLENTPKIISGVNSESLEHVKEFYSSIVSEVVAVSGTREAEMTKLIENTFRHVNIALMNELAIFSNNLGVNIWEAIDAASTKPYGFMPFRPGPGVGGHCLPIDPSYLSWHVKKELSQNFRFVELANEINTNMPEYVVQRANQMLNSMNKPIKNSSVVLLGLSYKKNSSDTREAPAIKIANILSSLGANIYGYDMHVPKYAWPKNITKIISNNDIFSTADIAIVLTDHDDIVVLSEALTEVPILDTKNVFSGKNITKL